MKKKIQFQAVSKAVKSASECQLVIKPHPAEDRQSLMQDLKMWKISDFILTDNKKIEIYDLLNISSVVIIAWSLIFFIYSFAMKWKGNSETFFYSDVLNLSSSVNEIGGVNWKILIALLAVWVVIYFCIWKGVNSVNKVIKPLIFIPAVCLVILLIRAVTLDGAVVGILYYIKPDFRALLDPAIWVAAIAQSFFTLSVASGAMIAYASYKPKKSDITKCAYVTAIADASISILAGFVVFGILGYMATVKGVTVSSVIKSGPGLAFVAFPEALSLMPWAVFFSLVFFLTLIAVGIASAFSLVQSIDTAILDDHSKWLKQNVSLVVCIAGFVMGIIFTTGAGMYFLDIVDHFAAEYGLLIIGLLECIIIGWFFGTEKLRQYINDVSDWKITKFWLFSIRYIIPIACTILIVRQVIQEVISPYGGYPLWALSIGWGVILFAFVCSVGFYFYDRRKRNK